MHDPIRWLHLSDFHVGKDDWAQRRLFEKIIEHVADQNREGFIPDLVFITGDIANAGQKSEYSEFRSGFLAPLLDALGGNDWHGTLYAVPGNHDVDRNKHPNVDRVSVPMQPCTPRARGSTSRNSLAGITTCPNSS